MKKIFSALFMVLVFAVMVLVFAVMAIAGTSGGSAPAVGKVNVPLTVPKKANAFCKTLVAGRATQATLDVSGTTMINWQARGANTASAAGTATVVKRYLGNASAVNSNGMNASSETNLPIESGVSRVVFERYSSDTTLSVCGDMN